MMMTKGEKKEHNRHFTYLITLTPNNKTHLIMASKPTEMCVVEKSGAREYKVLLLLFFSFLFFLLRLFLASVSFFHHLIIACCDYSFFSLSLSLPSLDRVALPLSSSTSGDGREEVERVARCCFRAPSSFVVVVYLCRPKSWARRDARRSWKRLD